MTPSFVSGSRTGSASGASPSVAYALNRAWFETDLREVLPSIRVPTLVLYRDVHSEPARDVADRIPGAKATRVSGTDFLGIWLSSEIPEEVERFVAGEPVAEVPDTVLATVLFTDIVGSSARAAELGDRAWRELLERHHALVRRELARYRGEEKDTAGDGFFATFDGPARAIRCARAIVESVRELGPRGAHRCAHRRMRGARGQGRGPRGRDRRPCGRGRRRR